MSHPVFPPDPPARPVWDLRLYVAGHNVRSLLAIANLRALCERAIPESYRIEVIDLLAHPTLAEEERVVAVPMVVRRGPLPVRRLIGDLTEEREACRELGFDLLRAAR